MSTCSRRISCSNRSNGPSKTGVWTATGTRRDYRRRSRGRRIASPPMTRVLSGIQPTGDIHLGNYLGAIRNWVTDQHEHDAFYCVVDLHALTVTLDPLELRAKTLQTATILLAAGLDPSVCTLFLQSHVHEHSELSWVLEC